MGNGQSVRVGRISPHTPFRYHRISPSNSLNQPLLDDDSQSMLPNLLLEANQKKEAALQREIRDLRSAVSRLESKLQSKATEAQGRNTNLEVEGEVNELKSEVSKLKYERQVDKAHKFKQEEAIEKVKRSHAALEDRVKKLSSTICENEMKAQVLSDAVIPQIETAISEKDVEIIPSTENDIAACLVVLIFLVSILIGINL